MNTITLQSERTEIISTINLDNAVYWEWAFYDSEDDAEIYILRIFLACNRVVKFLATKEQMEKAMLGFANPNQAIYKVKSEV